MGKDLKGKELGLGISQKKDGRYSGRFVDRFGRRVEVCNRNLKELRAEFAAKMAEDSKMSNVVDSSITVDEWFQKWIDVHKFDVIRASSIRTYKQVYFKHISPILGPRQLNKVLHLEIVGIIKDLAKRNYKYETQNKVRIILQDMYDKAMIDNLVVKNPARGIRLKREKRDIEILTHEEQKEFFACANGTFYNNLFQVAILSGLRMGEICALTWDDIDLENMWIDINKTLVYEKFDGDEKKKFHIQAPKTPTSKRRVPINEQCKDALLKQRRQKAVVASKKCYKPLENYEELLFTTKYGTPINAQTYNDAIKSIIDEVNLMRAEVDAMEIFSSHMFRHTFASRCFEARISPKIVQKYLGHATIALTMDLYTHVLEAQQSDAIDKLNLKFE